MFVVRRGEGNYRLTLHARLVTVFTCVLRVSGCPWESCPMAPTASQRGSSTPSPSGLRRTTRGR